MLSVTESRMPAVGLHLREARLDAAAVAEQALKTTRGSRSWGSGVVGVSHDVELR